MAPRFFSKGPEGSHGSKVLSHVLSGSRRSSQVLQRFSKVLQHSHRFAEVRSVSPRFAKVRQRRLDKVRKVLFWFAKVR